MSILHKIVGLTSPRDKWIDHVQCLFEDALGEYAKIQYGKLVDYDDIWSKKVEGFFVEIDSLMNKPLSMFTFWFNRHKALSEAFHNAQTAIHKILKAKSEFVSLYLEGNKKDFLDKVHHNASFFDSNNLLHEMVLKYRPKLYHNITRRNSSS